MRILAAIVVFLFCAAPAFASAPKALDIGPGEQVWFEEDHTVPMVAVTVALPAGSVYDPANKAGLAAFAAYMFNEGAGEYSSVAYQAAVANLGMQLSMSPDRDYLVLSFTTLSSHAKEAFRLFAPRCSRASSRTPRSLPPLPSTASTRRSSATIPTPTR